MGIEFHIDRDVCVGAGQCVIAAPRLFDQDMDGIVVLLHDVRSQADEISIRDAAQMCPSGAIAVRR